MQLCHLAMAPQHDALQMRALTTCFCMGLADDASAEECRQWLKQLQVFVTEGQKDLDGYMQLEDCSPQVWEDYCKAAAQRMLGAMDVLVDAQVSTHN